MRITAAHAAPGGEQYRTFSGGDGIHFSYPASWHAYRYTWGNNSMSALAYVSNVRLHYPCYWHYDLLAGLKVMAEAGFIGDPRCREALDLLESKRLPGGGFPAEARYDHSRSSGSRSRVSRMSTT